MHCGDQSDLDLYGGRTKKNEFAVCLSDRWDHLEGYEDFKFPIELSCKTDLLLLDRNLRIVLAFSSCLVADAEVRSDRQQQEAVIKSNLEDATSAILRPSLLREIVVELMSSSSNSRVNVDKFPPNTWTKRNGSTTLSRADGTSRK